MINPKDYLIICESYDSFHSFYGSDIDAVQGIDFGLNEEMDGVSLLDEDKPVFTVMYNSSTWPISDDCVLSLISPRFPLAVASSWEAVELPGAPGPPNPGSPSCCSPCSPCSVESDSDSDVPDSDGADSDRLFSWPSVGSVSERSLERDFWSRFSSPCRPWSEFF